MHCGKEATDDEQPEQARRRFGFRVSHGDLLRKPFSLRKLLETEKIWHILDGDAGARSAERMASFLKTVKASIEPVK